MGPGPDDASGDRTSARAAGDAGPRALNATAASLLGFLHAGAMTGWDLVGVAQDRIGKFWSITPSQVYRELGAMERAGLLDAGPTGPRERKPYSLTDAGRAAFAEWIRRAPGAETIRQPLLLAVTFGEHIPRDRLDEILAEQWAEHTAILEAYRGRRDEVAARSPWSELTMSFGIEYQEMMIRWIERVRKQFL